jgi:FKBP-type peptidyl-prolyl cis-trans isomerase FklB
MKKIILLSSFLSIVLISFGQHTHTKMESQIDSVSYAVGMNIGQSLKAGGIDTLNPEIFMQAIHDVLVEDHVVMNAQLAQAIVQAYLAKAQEAKFATRIAEGKKFLEENKKKPGVVALPSGLQYQIIKQGDGPIPVDGQKVKTHYHGTLLDGTVFDSSVDRGTPISFGVNGVIRGWTEALKMMPVGSKWKLFIPYDLAYGPRAMGAKIKEYSTLIFEVELLEIEGS